MKKEIVQVPYLIEEKLEIFWESVVLIRHIISLLRTGKNKGVFTCERNLRKKMGQFPLGMSSDISKAEHINSMVLADSCVLRSWFIARPNNGNDIEHWEEALACLLNAHGFLSNVYGDKVEQFMVITRKGDRQQGMSDARRKLALKSIEPFRLCQMYKRYTKNNTL